MSDDRELVEPTQQYGRPVFWAGSPSDPGRLDSPSARCRIAYAYPAGEYSGVVMSGVDRLFDGDVVQCPHAYYDELRDQDPVHRIEGTDAFLVSRLDLIKEVVGDPQRFSSTTSEFLYRDERGEVGLRPPIDLGGNDDETFGILATADPPEHTRHRALLSRILSTSTVKAREQEFRRLFDDADVLKAQGYASVELVGGFVTDEAVRDLQAKLVELGPAIAAFSTALTSADPDTTTVAGLCARAVSDGELDELESFGILATLLAAGGESTTSLLGSGVRMLAEQRDLQDRLRSDPTLIPSFVEEACRIEPPFRGHYRKVVTDTTLGDVALPAGSRLVLVWPAANRAPDLGADRVDLDRPNPRQHLGFGWGLHLCVGAPLARMEARVAFERLLARTSAFTIEPDTSVRHHPSLMIRRLDQLPLILDAAS